MKQTTITEENKLELFKFVEYLGTTTKRDYDLGAYNSARSMLMLMGMYREYEDWKSKQ